MKVDFFLIAPKMNATMTTCICPNEVIGVHNLKAFHFATLYIGQHLYSQKIFRLMYYLIHYNLLAVVLYLLTTSFQPEVHIFPPGYMQISIHQEICYSSEVLITSFNLWCCCKKIKCDGYAIHSARVMSSVQKSYFFRFLS